MEASMALIASATLLVRDIPVADERRSDESPNCCNPIREPS